MATPMLEGTPRTGVRSGLRARLRSALLPALLVLALAAAGLLGPATALRAEPNYYEQRKIEAQALEAFSRVIELWEEEAYFELYDHGMAASKARISREDFAQRMVQLSWKPEGALNPTHTKAEFRFRTVVYVTARIPYRGKFNPDDRFSKDQTLLLLQEDGQWKVDLIALIRAPYSGA
jgi:hypothetical protein